MKFVFGSKGLHAVPSNDLLESPPSGAYRLQYDARNDILYYSPTKLEYDKLVDLPSPEFVEILGEMNQFLDPKTKKSYQDHGFIYKRSVFLYGAPGTGKSCIVNRIAERVQKMEGIVIFNDSPSLTMMALEQLKNYCPNLLTLVILEEFDQIIDPNGMDKEEDMLRLLDGQVQKNNVIFLATTNFLEKIPKRILRPGRFSRLVKVNPPTLEARTRYIEIVSKDTSIVKSLAEKTEGFTIDELKEAVLSINCLGYKLDEAVDRIKSTSEITSRLKNNAQEEDVDLFDDYEGN
jgi:SpoVK/Ycf46/Vps4 family AAA+-type ATPase